MVFQSLVIALADGTGVISGGAFNGDIIVNDNFGKRLSLRPHHEHLHHYCNRWHAR
jgi:hypothetical protein